jgi:hypothetical protein
VLTDAVHVTVDVTDTVHVTVDVTDTVHVTVDVEEGASSRRGTRHAGVAAS